jgi:hypothetical protein
MQYETSYVVKCDCGQGFCHGGVKDNDNDFELGICPFCNKKLQKKKKIKSFVENDKIVDTQETNING